MALLEKYPVHVRRKIALVITGVLAIILIVVMVISYSSQSGQVHDTTATVKIKQFYATILESAQSYFGGNRGIMGK